MRFFSCFFLVTLLFTISCITQPPEEVVVDDTAQEETALTQEDVGQALLAKERQWLDRWAAGDPLGCIEILADDASCFDFGGAAKTRLDGIEAIRNYLASFVGQIPPHTYELVDPRVQVFGDTAVVT
ncbi:MAG: nuclear transport factor 2 family protein, partial [Acidobacteriota bacterium]